MDNQNLFDGLFGVSDEPSGAIKEVMVGDQGSLMGHQRSLMGHQEV